jgi:hypothetical protein
MIKQVNIALLLSLALAGMTTPVAAQSVTAQLQGSSEVPANDSAATGNVNITVAPDKSVSGTISTSGVEGKMAHIHSGIAGANGPVIVGLSRNGDNGWAVPPGARFTDEQYAAYLAGGLYVNVHSPSHPGGEIRAQLLP